MKNKIDPAISAEDLISRGSTPRNSYAPIRCNALIQGFDANGKEFTAKAKNCTLRLEQPSAEQLDMLTKDCYNKKFPYRGRIDVNLTEVMRQLFHRCPFGEIRLIYGEKVIATINTGLARYAERK